MHLADGIVSLPVLAGGTALAAAGVGIGLRRLPPERIPTAAMLAAAFFVASLIHVPVGPGQVHLIMNGLAGLILGWAAFPVLLIALLLQAILFGYGGITVLGVNTLVMAAPAVACRALVAPLLRRATGPRAVFAAGFTAGALAIAGSGLLLAAVLFLSDPSYSGAVVAILVAHLPVMLIEGGLTGAALVFLKKVRPETLPDS